MNFKSTIALLILAGGVGALVWKAAEVAPRIGLAPAAAPTASSKSAEALHALKPGEILAVTITSPGVAPIDFKSADDVG